MVGEFYYYAKELVLKWLGFLAVYAPTFMKLLHLDITLLIRFNQYPILLVAAKMEGDSITSYQHSPTAIKDGRLLLPLASNNWIHVHERVYNEAFCTADQRPSRHHPLTHKITDL